MHARIILTEALNIFLLKDYEFLQNSPAVSSLYICICIILYL